MTGAGVRLQLKTTAEPGHAFLELPWHRPLADWDQELFVRVPRGTHRHVVRFLQLGRTLFVLKELPAHLADREYRLIDELHELALPVVDLVGVAHGRSTNEGEPLESVLITQHLAYALPFRHLFGQGVTASLRDRLVDSLVSLLVRLHVEGFFWGDCSLNNALFRRDAGALAAYVVDLETGEYHEDGLSEGQRNLELEIASMNIAGGLLDLEAAGRLAEEVDPMTVVDDLAIRYDELWSELHRVDEHPPDEVWRIQERLRRLNELGFDTSEVELVRTITGDSIQFRPKVVEDGHHRRHLAQLTGIDAQENQARRLLNAIHSYGAWLERTENRRLPEGVRAYRWMEDRYQPTIDAIPKELRGRLEDAEVYHQVLEHLWYLNEGRAEEVSLDEAIADYVANVLSHTADERVLVEAVTVELPVIDGRDVEAAPAPASTVSAPGPRPAPGDDPPTPRSR